MSEHGELAQNTTGEVEKLEAMKDEQRVKKLIDERLSALAGRNINEAYAAEAAPQKPTFQIRTDDSGEYFIVSTYGHHRMVGPNESFKIIPTQNPADLVEYLLGGYKGAESGNS